MQGDGGADVPGHAVETVTDGEFAHSFGFRTNAMHIPSDVIAAVEANFARGNMRPVCTKLS